MTFVELPDVTKTTPGSAQDIGFRALESILRFQVKQKKLNEAARQLSIDDNKIFQSTLTQYLQPQLENHSRLVFLCSASPNGQIKQIMQILEFSRLAAQVWQNSITQNTI